MTMIDIRPTPRFVAILYAALEEPHSGWTCDRLAGTFGPTDVLERTLMGTVYAFMEENPDTVERINRELPEAWPDNEADLGFVCPKPAYLIPLMRG